MIVGVIGNSKEAVMEDTWGHLKPKSLATTTVKIAGCIGSSGDIVLLDRDLTGIPASPWEWEAVYTFIVESSDFWKNGQVMEFTGIVTPTSNEVGWVFDGDWKLAYEMKPFDNGESND